MPSAISITQSPSIAVVQGAYDWLQATGEKGEEPLCARSYSVVQYHSIWSPPPQTALPTEPPVGEWLKFQNLVGVWRSERGAMSSITEMAMCPAYQSIIGMGKTAISFILAQLEAEGEEPDQWFWALRAVTGENPVQEEDQGNYLKMARAWLQWGKSRHAW